MKIFISFLSAVALLAGSLFIGGCSSLDSSGLTKAQKKEIRAQEDSLRALVAAKAVVDRQFIAIADQITLRRGRTFNVNSSLNYVSLNGNDAVIQVASTSGWPGFNGLGGVTLKGTATDIRKSFDKKGNLSMSMRVSGSGLSGEVRLQMPRGSDRAYVQVKGTFSFNQLSMYCTVEPYDGTGVVQGSSL